MSEIIIPDVREEPWSEDATVVVDVANLIHWIQTAARHRVATAHTGSGAEGDPPGVPFSIAARGLHRVVDLLAHHGVRTGRLLLGTTLGAFPPSSTGWRPSTAGGQAQWQRDQAIATGRALVGRVAAALAPRGIEVAGLPGLFGSTGEHCVDELCVLAATHASWTGEGRDVIIVSEDADVAIAPLLAGAGRILLARRMGQTAAAGLADRLARHGTDIDDAPLPPAHLRLLGTAMRGLLQAEDLPEGRLRDVLASLPDVDLPAVELVGLDGRQVLRNAVQPAQLLSSPLDGDHDRSWFERRQPLVVAGVGATAVVDPFGLLATANRCDIAGRVPNAASVAEALEPLALPLPLGQLAVVPDLLDADHGLIAVAANIGGLQLIPRMRDVLTGRVRAGLVAIDDELEATLDSYAKDDLPETVATPSQFARGPLTGIGETPPALEEKESAVLLAADLMWALTHTAGPVVLVSDRPDLVALLDVMDDHFGAALGMRGRVARIGLQADPFSGEGIAVERSGAATRWPTSLVTGRMLVDLLRLGEAAASTDGASPAPTVADAIAYDPVLDRFTVHDLEGRRVGDVGIDDVVQLPVDDIALIGSTSVGAAARLRIALARALRLHLDLRVPLPSPRLARSPGERLVGASVLSARVVGHHDDHIVVRVTSSTRSGEVLDARMPDLGAVPAFGTDVEIVVDDDGEHCRLLIPDLKDVPDTVGRPRPARVTAADRVELLGPLDPTDLRDDSGREVRARRLLGPYPTPSVGDVVLVTTLDADLVQVVSTPLPWVDAMRS
jgi:hypothetical protein